ncbi:hypothetical protein DQY98_20130 [Salmonella enterica subsp. enterica serovar Saintpaul]|nr:hypothetical protein [Salmonella enterica subsp. enterica serovar Saintpaul]EBX0752880.1 hypothetical protein [Salmonella enterica subsp. enterica serovar Saintpaul]ECB0581363.1 hypothetical protein [Salmonella enterica subsp. enterica serovar Saintpaul]ECI6579422.1 hypothetical protein [Salmonella enterica subsp. enterica serovar Saintpaul]
MLYLLSHDVFLLNGLRRIDSNISIAHLTEIKMLRQLQNDTIIIDGLCYPGKIMHCLLSLTGSRVIKIIVLCSFSIAGLSCPLPVSFFPRTIRPELLSTDPLNFFPAGNIPLPILTLTELSIIDKYLSHYTDTIITENLQISLATLRQYKYHLMLKLKLKKMSQICQTEHYLYLSCISPGLLRRK